MSSVTIRISRVSHRALKELATRSGEPMQKVVSKALEEYRRRLLLEQTNAAFAKLRRNRRAWQQELSERAAWDQTLRDLRD